MAARGWLGSPLQPARDRPAVTPIHLLLALLTEGDVIAAHVLEDLDLAVGEDPGGSPQGGSIPATSRPLVGARVLVHDPEPRYRLWEGRMTARASHRVTVAIQGQPSRSEASLSPAELHAIPLSANPTCERCLSRAGTQKGR